MNRVSRIYLLKYFLVVRSLILDFEIDYEFNDQIKSIKVFKKENAPNKWYSIGFPFIVKNQTPSKSKSKSFFHFNKNGFFVYVRMLTKDQKKLIIEKLKNLYTIDVEMNQIVETELSKFECSLEFQDIFESIDIKLRGSLKSGSNRLEFVEKQNSRKYTTYKNNLKELNNPDFKLICEIESQYKGFELKNFVLEHKMD